MQCCTYSLIAHCRSLINKKKTSKQTCPFTKISQKHNTKSTGVSRISKHDTYTAAHKQLHTQTHIYLPVTCSNTAGAEFNALSNTIQVTLEAVFTANHLTNTDKQKQYRKIHNLNTIQTPNNTKYSKTKLVQLPIMTLELEETTRTSRTTWMKTIQQDPRSNNLSLDEAITVAQNRPLWRLMSAFGATHPQWCLPHKKKKKKMSKVKVTGNENLKIVFRAHFFVKSGPIYIKPRPK